MPRRFSTSACTLAPEMAVSERGGVPEVPFGTVVGGDFMVVRPLGRGAMGALYVAEQLSTSSNRALKVLRREYVSDETLFKRFEREAHVVAKIPSEHVTQVIAAGVDEKLQAPWIAMELLEGHHLGAHVEENGPSPKELVRAIFEQLCHAIGAAHSMGVVHRDLKPANIFLSEARRVGAVKMVKVLDFGIARVVKETLTLAGTPLGTPAWMAPEQLRGENATTSADVWTLGLLAFYMLTGRSFWRSQEEGYLVKEVLVSALPTASIRALELGVGPLIPPGFDEWFALSLARDPGARFVNATAAYAALTRALA